MTTELLRKTMRNGSAALILTGLLGTASLLSANSNKPATPAPKAAAPAAKPAGGAGGGTHGATGGAAHTTMSTGAHTTTTHTTTTTTHTTTTTGSHTTTTGGMHTTTTGGMHTTTTGGAHTTTAGGMHTTGGGAAGGMHGGGAGGNVNHSAFHGGPAPRGSNEHVTRSGGAVRTRPNGRVSDVHDARRGMDVHHGLAGGRRVDVERPGHGHIYAERGRAGYVQRGYGFHGHDYGRRAYFYHGHEYNRYYHGWGYRGMYMNVYAPGYFYGAGFYGWAYNPWVAPISFGWGWGGAPWYGRYGYYFQPYPVYPSAAFWLTDYIISQDLQAVYAAHQEAAIADGTPQPAAGGPPVLTPEVKAMIAEEVKNQIALENQEATANSAGQDVDPGSSGIARLLSDGRPHVFVAGGNLDVTDASGQECAVSDGDTLQLRTPPPSDATSANLVVLSSKGTPECQISLTVQVSLTDLQEMQNHMRETIDQGLQDLQSKQGTGGLPGAPPSAQSKPVQAAYAAVAPPPDPGDAATIQQQDQQADQAEKDVTAETAAPGGGQASATPPSTDAPAQVAAADTPAAPAATASVEMGQTKDQVQAALGAPTRVADLGPKTIYYYNGMKVTFKDGKVSDVQ